MQEPIHHRGRRGTRRKDRNEKKGHRHSSVSSAVKVPRFFLSFAAKNLLPLRPEAELSLYHVIRRDQARALGAQLGKRVFSRLIA